MRGVFEPVEFEFPYSFLQALKLEISVGISLLELGDLLISFSDCVREVLAPEPIVHPSEANTTANSPSEQRSNNNILKPVSIR